MEHIFKGMVRYQVPFKSMERKEPVMQAVTFSAFRKNLRAFLDKTRDDAAPLLVTSKDPTANVVVINAAEYDNLMENLRIMSNDYLMDKLMKGKEQIAANKAIHHELVMDDDSSLDR